MRKVRHVFRGQATQDGAGVRLHRVFGYHEIPQLDPFLMLDFFDSENPADYIKGFLWHPHRGIETITFLYEGQIDHGDSLGNRGSILSGDCQWMTAGSGIIHQEMPQSAPLMLGFQLWANLAAQQKMTNPAYHEIKAADIESYEKEGVTIRIIAGRFDDIEGPDLRPDIRACFLDLSLSSHAVFERPTQPEDTYIALLVRGEATFDLEGSPESQPGSALLFDQGTAIRLQAGIQGARILLISGTPLGEPIAWGGPIVMNTEEELELAFREYQNGTFLKHP